jgi:multidrug efflux pump subunit AcrA (membrane-fusion protein)
MAELVTMPKLGFDMAEGTLVRWVKAEGDPVEKGEVIAEIETDKATVEVESSYQGVMFRHLAGEGAELPVNAPIAVVSMKVRSFQMMRWMPYWAARELKPLRKQLQRRQNLLKSGRKAGRKSCPS